MKVTEDGLLLLLVLGTLSIIVLTVYFFSREEKKRRIELEKVYAVEDDDLTKAQNVIETIKLGMLKQQLDTLLNKEGRLNKRYLEGDKTAEDYTYWVVAGETRAAKQVKITYIENKITAIDYL